MTTRTREQIKLLITTLLSHPRGYCLFCQTQHPEQQGTVLQRHFRKPFPLRAATSQRSWNQQKKAQLYNTPSKKRAHVPEAQTVKYIVFVNLNFEWVSVSRNVPAQRVRQRRLIPDVPAQRVRQRRRNARPLRSAPSRPSRPS